MKGNSIKQQKIDRRHKKIRARVLGSASCPRLSVYKSNRFMEAQLIDDEKGATIFSSNTRSYGAKGGTKVEAAKKLGVDVAARAKEKGITKIVFDRGGFRYIGRVAAVAAGAREGGLTF